MQTDCRAILSLLTILAIGFLVFKLYRDYAVASFRQGVFILRDELFDYATSGEIGFDHAAYQLLRTTMNGFIRYGHRLSLTELLVFSILNRRNPEYDDTYSRRWNEVIGGLDKSTILRLLKYRVRMNMLVIQHLIIGSPGLMITMIIPVAFFTIYHGAKTYCRTLNDSLQSLLKSPLNDLDAVAAAIGS